MHTYAKKGTGCKLVQGQKVPVTKLVLGQKVAMTISSDIYYGLRSLQFNQQLKALHDIRQGQKL